MFSDFSEAVLKDYNRKKFSGRLSGRLIDPSPGDIKQECLSLLDGKTDQADYQVIRDFFRMKSGEDDYEKAIRTFENTKFKPLQNLIVKGSVPRNDNVVKLLAWLIDFRPRPYVFGMTIEQLGLDSDDEIGHQNSAKTLNRAELERREPGSGTGPEISEKTKEANITSNQTRRSIQIKFPLVVTFVLMLMIAGYYALNRKSDQYMTWNGFKYQMVNKDEVKPGVLGLMLDDRQLNHQQWISCADSITRRHVGKIWYIRNNNLVELFTSDGVYPPEPTRKLHILTDRIYNNFIVPGKVREDCQHSRSKK